MCIGHTFFQIEVSCICCNSHLPMVPGVEQATGMCYTRVQWPLRTSYWYFKRIWAQDTPWECGSHLRHVNKEMQGWLHNHVWSGITWCWIWWFVCMYYMCSKKPSNQPWEWYNLRALGVPTLNLILLRFDFLYHQTAASGAGMQCESKTSWFHSPSLLPTVQ